LLEFPSGVFPSRSISLEITVIVRSPLDTVPCWLTEYSGTKPPQWTLLKDALPVQQILLLTLKFQISTGDQADKINYPLSMKPIFTADISAL
jgi:hypothetical protein